MQPDELLELWEVAWAVCNVADCRLGHTTLAWDCTCRVSSVDACSQELSGEGLLNEGPVASDLGKAVDMHQVKAGGSQ